MKGSKTQLLPTAKALYGDNLNGANKTELIDILVGCAMELDWRSKDSKSTNFAEHLHDAAMSASDDDILTLLVAAAIRLRLPNLCPNTQILTPLIPSVAD